MRVAVSQFATTINVQENLARCIRMINEAAICQPSLIVLPEFCNTLFCNTQVCYLDHEQAWNDAVAIDGPFLKKIAEQAIKHKCYIVINVTVRRDFVRELSNDKQSSDKSKISVTSCLFSPLGELIHQEDKQTLVGHENDFFISACKIAQVKSTPFGKLGLLSGSDTLTFEASRDLALSGAQLLCNSINSFALDQTNLHDAARACENDVFLVTANKIGSLVAVKKSPEKNEIVSAVSHIPQTCLVGVGRSQIVAPNGKVLAKMTNSEEGFVFADISLEKSNINNKCRPDGTQFIKHRRPELYQQLMQSVKQRSPHEQAIDNSNVPITANVAIFATYKSNEQAIEDVCHYIENNLSDIIQLPELFFIADKTITNDAEKRDQITALCKQVIKQVSSVLRLYQYLCTSLLIDGMHQAVIINKEGIFASQVQLHFCQRYQWTALADKVNVIELPLEQGNINVAMLTADDANIPEIVKVAALNDCHLLLIAYDIQEPCEVTYNLLSRAAENRICIVAASREKDFADDLSFDNTKHNIYSKNKVKHLKSTGLIINLTTDPTSLPQWQARAFNGYINQPLVKHQYGKITKAVIHPIAACNKQLATNFISAEPLDTSK